MFGNSVEIVAWQPIWLDLDEDPQLSNHTHGSGALLGLALLAGDVRGDQSVRSSRSLLPNLLRDAAQTLTF